MNMPARIYRADGLRPLVAISGDTRLEHTLGRIMVGWGLVSLPEAPDGHCSAPHLTVRQGPDGWTCSGLTYPSPITYGDPVAAGCSVLANLFKAHTLVDDAGFILHAAGVRIGSGVALLTGDFRAGKSVVSAACAAAGLQVFSDDIIPLAPDGRTACAPGLSLRLRLPLPETLGPDTRSFIDAHATAAGERYLYVRPPPDRLAGFGERAPIRAIVALHRREGESARLERLPAGGALREAIRRNFARELPAGRILRAFHMLVSDTPCLRLTYDRAEDAAELLAEGLEGDFPEAGALDLPEIVADSPAGTARLLADGTLVGRVPGIGAVERGGEVFLTDAAERTIFNLNPTAAAVWNLSAEPIAFGDLVEIFSEAFPERSRTQLATDLSDLIGRLAREGLLTTRRPVPRQRPRDI